MNSKYISRFFEKGSFKTKAFYTILDQAVLSIVNLLIGISMIIYGTQEHYGYYTVLIGLFNLYASVQNAVINTPMIVLSPRMSEEDAVIFRKGLFVFVLIFFLVSTIITSFFIFFSIDENLNILSYVIISFAIGALLFRDYFRSEEYAQLKPLKALKRDTVYSILSLMGLVSLVLSVNISVQSVFFIIGFSALLVSLVKILPVFNDRPSTNVVKKSFEKSWEYSKWSLVGASSSWLQGNAFVYVPFFLINVKEVALLAAARLMMTPITLLISSWGNVMRPVLSKNLADNKKEKAKNLMVKATLLLLCLLLLYTILILCIIHLIPTNFLPNAYSGVNSFIIIWFAVYFVRIIRTNLSSYLQSALRFKLLAVVGLIISLITVITTIIGVALFGTDGALYGLVISELLYCIVLSWVLKEKNIK
ncbi:hypothetical protein P5F80_03775 [Shouchella clausii]|uniref:lipopolysaccharide biosynthesis protein n=1 Tax=Shouchella clausii TaxID=79880 RepID=UPI001C2457BE|nr:hypothetical protein [Shouchella clausii]MBU8595955.1 hypothetical protein [Shouchella clausii]MED4157536.1 hypothetical protein [Shouchella clausii]MED4175629.1 hypothetical protein [Shouchella clausii]